MTDKEKAKELASLLVGEDQNPQPLIDVLLDMAKWKETQVKESAESQHKDKTCKENSNSLTQEPVSESIDFEQELYKAFGQIKDFTLGIAIAKRFYDIGRKHKEPVSEILEDAAVEAFKQIVDDERNSFLEIFKAGAKWQKENLWKPADGDDLPEIDREVIALLDNGKVVFAHRPPEYWDGKDIVTGKVTRNYPKTYDKGGWNIPDIKYWLDVELPKEIEL